MHMQSHALVQPVSERRSTWKDSNEAGVPTQCHARTSLRTNRLQDQLLSSRPTQASPHSASTFNDSCGAYSRDHRIIHNLFIAHITMTLDERISMQIVYLPLYQLIGTTHIQERKISSLGCFLGTISSDPSIFIILIANPSCVLTGQK